MAQVEDDRISELLQEVFSDQDGLRRFLEVLVNQAMQAEATEHLGAERHQRNDRRRGHRNGVKPRTLGTRVGSLQLSVPQTRNCEPYHPSMFARWQRSERALLVACAEMYFQGVSTRKVQEVLQEMCGMEISSATVSRVASELDEKLEEFRSRRLEETTYPYLLIDARYEHVRVDRRVVSQAVMVSAGVTAEGRREILDWRVGDSESEATWSEVFRQLKDRGLQGLELVISDANEGIRAAMKRHLQGVPWQRCRVHFLREMSRKVSYKAMREVLSDAKGVFRGEDRQECLRRGEEMAAKWEGRCPAVAKMLREGLEDTLTVQDLPGPHRRRLNSTNMLESLMRRLKRRTNVVGVFPNRASCERLVGAMLLETHEDWATERAAYIGMGQWTKGSPGGVGGGGDIS
jgi:transposase-like protein